MIVPSTTEVGFLRRLDAGVDYAETVYACGRDGLKVALACTLNGWVERGRITAAGRRLIMPVVTLLPRTSTLPSDPDDGTPKT